MFFSLTSVQLWKFQLRSFHTRFKLICELKSFSVDFYSNDELKDFSLKKDVGRSVFGGGVGIFSKGNKMT